jgi:hypothetical protein
MYEEIVSHYPRKYSFSKEKIEKQKRIYFYSIYEDYKYLDQLKLFRDYCQRLNNKISIIKRKGIKYPLRFIIKLL